MTSRELVYRTLSFQNYNGRVPRQLWYLPWSEMHYPQALSGILADFHWDIVSAPCIYERPPKTAGDPYRGGRYTDEWGCRFHGIQDGVFGEVKEPIVGEDDWSDAGNVHIPDELLSFDADAVNRFCEKSGDFVMCNVAPRPFEQLQFMRGTENLLMDLTDPPAFMKEFIKKMHAHYCGLLEKWAKTDVDALMIMDDWGSQTSLLISPACWTDLFMPLYRDYIGIGKAHGKKVFMHSDGHTLAIIPYLIGMGLDALNAQIFCIGLENLAQFRGKLTFWGEIDRQRLLPDGTPEEIDAAVDRVYETLWDGGGCIAQCEFGAMAKPENVRRVFERWDQKAGCYITGSERHQ